MMAKAPDPVPVASLLPCPVCKVEMCLFGIESDPDQPKRELYTFECPKCARLEVRGVVLR